MTVAFAVIAHDSPRLVARLTRLLLESGGIVAIHYDAQAPAADFAELQDLLSGYDQRVLWAERVAVSWGQWSMVRATLNLLDAIAAAGGSVDYVHLMSGADYPIAPTTDYLAFLERAPQRADLDARHLDAERYVAGDAEPRGGIALSG